MAGEEGRNHTTGSQDRLTNLVKPADTHHWTYRGALRARRRWLCSLRGRDAYVHKGGKRRYFVSYIDYRKPERDPEQQALDYELVRVSREMVERLIEDDSEPVVVMRLQRHEDGTCELWLQKVVSEAERLREALKVIAASGDDASDWTVFAREALSGPAPNEDRG